MSAKNYKRMAKNAGMLYFRMLLTMAVTLYTSRVILQTLGVEDFGIYNVVAGFVTMLGFLHGAMSSATQRFIAFEIGRAGEKDVQGIFSMSMNIHILIAFTIFIIGETIGLWFLKNQLTIPVERLSAAQWVFQFSLLSFMVTIISVPFNALIIAHEEMGIFAAVSIVDVTLKLLIVFMLSWVAFDKLALYGFLTLVVNLIIFLIYRSYCKGKFEESKFRLYWDRVLFKTMLSYTGWNLWGSIASVLSGQGTNILLNIFFGPSVNAARAIAMQVSSALNRFVQNIQVAINPQIIKSYAIEDMSYMHRLVCYGSKYNFFFLLILSMPVLINTDIILQFWLDIVPKYTKIFVQLIIINILIDCLSAPLMTSAQATGKIKLYQIVVGGILLLNLPITYLILKTGVEPYTVVYIGITLSILALIARLIILRKLVSLPVKQYMQTVILRVILVSIMVMIIYHFLILDLFEINEFLWKSASIFLAVLISIITVGLTTAERKFIIGKLNLNK